MTTRRRWHISALAAAALIVAGCGGGNTDSPLATRVIAFGDSLTDLGTYVVATSISGTGAAPHFGGKFTTNSHTGYTATSNTSNANIWVEWIAARLGVAITPAEIGFGATRIPCPAAARGLAASCSGYGQGGSRVTDPIGINNDNGALTIPIVDQIASHNTRAVPGFKAGFDSGDIVFIWGGNNDVFVQAEAVAQGLPPDAAQANIVTAGTELATLIKDEILAKGAKRVAVLTAADSSLTPYGSTLSPEGRALLSGLSAAFNAALLAGLDGSGARIIDARALFGDAVTNPAKFGFTNATTPACNAQIIAGITGGAVTDGSSLFCNAAPAALFTAAGLPSLNAITPGASASTYVFADGVHPTTGAHKAFADQVWLKLKDFGWAPDNL
jgi:phospholipase/lecithinase/hemolysin